MENLIKTISSAMPLLWTILALALLIVVSKPLMRLLNALVRRVERGDPIKVATWITLGSSVGPLKMPPGDGCVTDDHVSLIHRSWRVEKRDAEFGGKPMYQIHVILFGEPEALDRVEYVLYRLDPSYPEPVKCSSSRPDFFQLKELANGYSLLRAEVKIKEQRELIYLSRFIDLTMESPKLKGTYF
jgi:hypothetical protein